MKYWWLGLGLLVGTAQAAVYPAILNHDTGHEFAEMSNLRDVYSAVYDDVRGESSDEICKRVQERIPEDWGDQNWQQECEDLFRSSEYRVSSADEAQATLTRSAQSHRQDQLAEWFAIERDFLRLERYLARKSAIEQMFSDGDWGGDGQKTSPFDVVADLNDLDVLMYGEKATAPDPEYAHRAEEPLRDHRDEPFSALGDEDPWLAQTEDDLPPYKIYTQDSDQISEDASVSGTLQATNDLLLRLFSQCPALAAESMAKHMFGGTHVAGMLAGSGSSMQMVALPSTLKEETVPVEMRTTEDIKESRIDAILRQLLEQLDPTRLRRDRDKQLLRQNVLGQVALRADTVQTVLDQQVTRANRDRQNQLENTEGIQFQQGLDSLRSGMMLWYEKMTEWEDLFKNLANKPVE